MRHCARALVSLTIVFGFSLQAREVQTQTPRRKFLSGLASVGIVGVGMGTASAAAKVIDVVAKPKDQTFSKTVVETHLMLIGKLVANHVFEKMTGLETGNANLTEDDIRKMLENPVEMWINVAALGPLIEESLFRGLVPFAFGSGWITGTASSAVFAAAHGLEKVPVSHFLGGIFYWYLMKNFGFAHAYLAHAAHNHVATIALLLGQGLDETSRAAVRDCEFAFEARP